MRVKLIVILAGIVFVATLALTVGADEAKEAKHEYVGAKKCGLKPCHGKRRCLRELVGDDPRHGVRQTHR